MIRLNFMRLICIEMYEESSDRVKEEGQRKMQDETLDMPECLLEALDILREVVKAVFGKSLRADMSQ